METYLSDSALVTGSKAVCLKNHESREEEAVYTDDYVPDSFHTENPEEVRYLIRCVRGSTVVGYYSGGGVGTRPWVELTVEDLKTGKILGQQSFVGGDPPKTVSAKPGESVSRSGNMPSEKVIVSWVLDVLEGRVTESTVPDLTVTEGGGEKQETTDIPENYVRALQIAEELLAEERGHGPVSLQSRMVKYEDCTEEEAAYAVENCGADWNAQALAAAEYNLGMKDYGFGPWSLQETLIKDGFTDEQIAYALINCDADWKEQALKLARYHTDWSYSHMCRSLVKVYGFSEEDAKYGADNCSNDWNKAAAEHVKLFLEYSDMSYTREEMIREMVDQYGFTEDQAIYGVNQNGMK